LKNLLFIGSNSELARDLRVYLNQKHSSLNISGISRAKKSLYVDYCIKNYLSNNFTNLLRKILSNKNIDMVFIFNGSSDENLSKDELINSNLIVPSNIVDICSTFSLKSRKPIKIIFASSVASQFIKKSNYTYGLSKYFVENYLIRTSTSNPYLSYLIYRLGPFNSKLTKNFKQKFAIVSIRLITIGIYKKMFRIDSVYSIPSIWFLINIILNFFPFLKKRL